MRLDLGPSIETIRAEALALVDKRAVAAAEALRPAHLAAMDALRLAQAREAANTAPQYCTAEMFPVLATIPGEGSIRDKALSVIEAAEQVAQARLALESRRLAAKAAIRAAATIPAIRAVTLEDQHHA